MQADRKRPETGFGRGFSPVKGQKMIGTLAQKRTQLAALAVLVALAVAFASVYSSVRADSHWELGDVNGTTAVCLQTTSSSNVYALFIDGPDDGATVGLQQVAQTDDARLKVYKADSMFDDTTTADEVENVGNQPGLVDVETGQCEAQDDGDDQDSDPDAPSNVGSTFKVTPDGSPSPIIEVQAPTLLLLLGDTDGIVNAGRDISFTVLARNLRQNSATQGYVPSIQWVRVSGEIDHPQTSPSATEGGVPIYLAQVNAGDSGTIVIPDGTTEGEYTASVLAFAPDGPDVEVDDPATTVDESLGVAGNHPSERMSASAKFTVGDAGVNAAAVELSLATSASDDATTTVNEQVDETGTTGASGSVWLKIAATNSLGNKSNDGASVLNSLTLIAPGGNVAIYAPGPGDSIVRTGPVTESIADSASAASPTDVMYARVSKKGSPPKPGTVDVYALLIGSDGAPRSEVVTLSFTGSASVLELGDAPNIGKESQREFTISATDAGGSTAAINRVTFKVTDADGDPVGASAIDVDQSTQGAHTDTKADNNPRQVTGLISTTETTAAGSYTISVSLVGVADSTATTELTVVGLTAEVSVEASQTESMTIGDIVKVTATLSDEDGNAAPDGTLVNFSASENTGLSEIGASHTGVKTKGGTASSNYAVVGAGTSVISATAGDSGVIGVVVVISTAGTAAAADEAVSLACLSATNGFATYTCDMDSSASELFGLVSGRGATAVHLWNGSDWVRYSVVDGAMVPGSSDFSVTDNDILYISN